MCGGSVEQFVAPISIVKVEGARNLQICQEGECINVPKGTHIPQKPQLQQFLS